MVDSRYLIGLTAERPNLADADYQFICNLVREHFGIELGDNKRALVVGRLAEVLRARGMADFAAYRRFLESPAGESGLDELVNRITTNHTYFYREPDHFEHLAKVVIPSLKATKRERELKIWCAGCSSGEEAYVLAITLMEALGAELPRWNVGVLATDISERVLTLAREGLYPADRISSTPKPILNHYFEPAVDGAYRVGTAARKLITFRRFNLMNTVFPFKNQFDVIFCRNVMIYFDASTREALSRRFFHQTIPGGYFYIGHAESISRSATGYQYLKPAIYQRPDGI